MSEELESELQSLTKKPEPDGSMIAVLCPAYGAADVLRVSSVPRPVPKANEVLIRVKAINVFPGDCEMRRFQVHPSMFIPVRLAIGLFKPRSPILGQEMSGVVEQVGSAVTRFKPGDEIFGSTGFHFGAYAEFVALPETYALTHKPKGITHQAASTISLGGLHAVHFLERAKLASGEKILIFGAAGCIGSYAVQIARLMGAEVTAVDSADKLELLGSLGAHKLIDYRQQDFTQNGEKYDVIFDIVGKSSYTKCLQSLSKNGRYVLANVGLTVMLRGAWTSRTSDKKVISKLAGVSVQLLDEFKQLMLEGKVSAAIDKEYSLNEMAAAHQYIDEGKKKGHVVVLPSS